MNIHNITCIFVIFIIFNASKSLRILGIYPLPVRSHFILFNEFFKALVEKGHTVDLINILSHNEKHSNYTQIIKLENDFSLFNGGITYETATSFFNNMNSIMGFADAICKHLGNPKVLKLASNPPKDPPYDLIITQMLNYPCYYIFGYLWDIPVVTISTSSLYPWMHDSIGNPGNIAISSSNIADSKPKNNFWDRFYNAYEFYKFKALFEYYRPNQDKVLRNYFGPNVPSTLELERNISLIFVNSYFSINTAMPTTTGLIEVAGLHIQKEITKLPDDLKKWLDESKNGVIYFNFGSLVRLETMPKDKLTSIFKSLENIAPTRVLLKLSNPKDLLIKIPKNSHVLPWIPQQSVLNHPNVKGFITHGGLLGTQESMYFGVPMICVPFFADQFTNCKTYVEKEIAIMLDHYTINENKLSTALHEILNNPIYRNNAKKVSKLFKDRPLTAMDTAIFWTEYVVRNGKHSLRSKIMELTWWQNALLDVYAVVACTFLICLFIITFIIKQLISILFGTKKNSITNSKKNN